MASRRNVPVVKLLMDPAVTLYDADRFVIFSTRWYNLTVTRTSRKRCEARRTKQRVQSAMSWRSVYLAALCCIADWDTLGIRYITLSSAWLQRLEISSVQCTPGSAYRSVCNRNRLLPLEQFSSEPSTVEACYV